MAAYRSSPACPHQSDPKWERYTLAHTIMGNDKFRLPEPPETDDDDDRWNDCDCY